MSKVRDELAEIICEFCTSISYCDDNKGECIYKDEQIDKILNHPIIKKWKESYDKEVQENIDLLDNWRTT